MEFALRRTLHPANIPHESRFADPAYALAVADVFLDELQRHGVTTALTFATSHPASVDALLGQAEARGLRIAQMLDTGMCHINCSSVNDEPHVPFGGSKASGLGRHGGRWSHETFTETRWITLDRGGRPFPPMF